MDNISTARGLFSGSLLEEVEMGLSFFNGQVCIYGNMDKWIRRNIENDK